MANNSSKDVELRIRARDYSQKTLQQVTSAINLMSKAQDQQAQAAARGQTSMKDLENTYRKLESAGQALLKLNSLVEVYKRQTAALQEQQDKVAKASKRLDDLRNKMGAMGPPTLRMVNDLGRAERGLQSATKKMDDMGNRVTKTGNELSRFGINASNLASAQASIITQVSRVNAVLERQEKIILRTPEALSRYKAAQEAAKRAQDAQTEATRQAMARTEEQAYAQNRVIDGLRRQAEAALAASRGYQTLGRVIASIRVQPGSNGLANQVSAIISPAQAARSTLNGLEQQVNGLNRAIAASNGTVENAKQKLRELQAAQQATVSMARLIDLFRQQNEQLRTARAEFNNAKASVRSLAEQMRSAQTDTGLLGQQMQAAQQRLQAAASALRNTGSAARDTQSSLRNAGIDTRNLSEAERRLIQTSKESATAINGLAESLRRGAGAARDGKSAFDLFNSSGRTTLSTVQRLRGEILSLVSAYAGLQGGINLAGGAVDAFKVKQQALVKISTVVGRDSAVVNSEWEYMEGLAERLGLKLQDVAKGYTSFAVAAKSIGLNLQETKFIFESISKAGRVFHLSADDMNGIFRAMQQMLSKGQVYAEELNGQLGERLPGAVALFAKGMDMTTGELLKAMQNGEVSGEAVINFAREQAKAIDAQLATAEKGVDAMEARAANAMFNFKLALANSGFIESYVQMLARITEYLRSDDGAVAAEKIGHAFSKAADAVVWMIDNIDGLTEALKVLAGLYITKWVIGLANGLTKLWPLIKKVGEVGDAMLGFLSRLGARLAGAGGVVGALGTSLKALSRAIPYVGWALLAYDIGAIFYEQSQTFAKAVDEVVRDFKNLANQIAAILQTPTAALQDFVYAIVRPITTLFSDTLTSLAKWIADVLRLIPGVGESLADWVTGLADNLTKENRDMFQNVKGIWQGVNDEWKRMNDDIIKTYGTTMDEVAKQSLAAKVKMLKDDMAVVNAFQYTADPESGVTPRDREIKGLTKQFDKLTKSAEAAELAGKKALQRKNLSGRLALVDEEFAPQMARAKAVGGAEGDKLVAQLNKVIEARKRAETDEYNASQSSKTGIDKRARAIENLTQKYKELQASIQAKETNQDPSSTLADRISAAVAKSNTQFDELIAKSNKLGGADGKRLADQYTALKTVNAEYLNQKMQLEEVERLQAKVNSLMAIRKARIEEINSKREAGTISEDTQVASVNQVNQETEAPINNALNSLQQQVDASKSLLGPEKWAELQANIAATKASLVDLTGTFTQMDTTIVQGVLDGMATALNSIVAELVKVGTGAQSMGEAFSAAGVAVLSFFAQFLQKIAIAILQQMALNAIAGMGGGIGAAAGALGGVAAKHNGGVIGDSTSSGGTQQRGMNPSWFVNARRYHEGGLPGLKSDEVPAILQKGEQVLAADDPNNIMNTNASSARTTSPAINQRLVLVDDRSKIPEAMNAPEGEEVIMRVIHRNIPTLRAALGKRK